MSLPRLLELWAEIEPSKCSYASGIFVLRGWTLSYDSDLSERLTLGEIQSAVQDAIEHRDWNWYLARVTIDGTTYYKALISIYDVEQAEEFRLQTQDFLSTHSAAYALLEAYLHALIMHMSLNGTEPVDWAFS